MSTVDIGLPDTWLPITGPLIEDLDPHLAWALYGGSRILVCPPVYSSGDPCPYCIQYRWIRARATEEREALLTESRMFTERRGVNPWLNRMVSQVSEWIQPRQTVLVAVHDLRLSSAEVMRWSGCQAAVHQRPLEGYQRSPEQAYIGEMDLVATRTGRRKTLQEIDLPDEEMVGEHFGVLTPKVSESWFNPVSLISHGVMREPSIFEDHTLEFGMNGHGRTRAESRTLSLLEGMERHSGLVKRNHDNVVVSSLHNLEERALDPAEFGLYPEEHFTAARNHLGHVRWSPDLEIEWVRGASVSTGETVWVPRQMVYYLARGNAPTFVQDNSNGCALGFTLQECFTFGAYEVIERDAFLVNWLARSSMPKISTECLDSFDSRAQTFLARLKNTGYTTYLFDSRADLPVPSVVALVVRDTPGPGRIAVGAASSLDPADALRGALKEAASNAPAMPTVYASDPKRAQALHADPSRVFQLRDHGLLYSVPGALDQLSFWLDDEPGQHFDDVFEDWFDSEHATAVRHQGESATLLQILSEADLEPILVEQTSDETLRSGMRAAKTFIPGLLPLDFGAHEMRAWHLSERAHLKVQPGDRINTYPHPFT